MVWVVWDKDLQLTGHIYRPWARADGGHTSWHPKICEEDKHYGGGIWQELLESCRAGAAPAWSVPISTYLSFSRASCLQSVLCALVCSSEPLRQRIKQV